LKHLETRSFLLAQVFGRFSHRMSLKIVVGLGEGEGPEDVGLGEGEGSEDVGLGEGPEDIGLGEGPEDIGLGEGDEVEQTNLEWELLDEMVATPHNYELEKSQSGYFNRPFIKRMFN
jgi:hypothetical protein